jgi:polar amino acid transport system substrate-binding protein
MKSLICPIACLLISLMLTSIPVCAEPARGTAGAGPLHLARNELAAEQAVAALVLEDIYQRAGLKFTVTPMPGARANTAALAGKVDGEVARVQAYADKNTSLLKLDPPYYYLTTAAFARTDRKLSIRSRDDLAGLKVGYVRGIAHAELQTTHLENVTVISAYDRMYEMLQAGRIDVALDTGANGAYMINKYGLTDLQPVGTLARHDLFHILHSSRRDLAPRVQAVIKQLRESRQLEKIVREREQQFFNSGMTP